MFTLRCTQKLLKRLGDPVTGDLAPSTTILGDWYANVYSLPFRGKSVVMFMNEPTRLVVLVQGRGGRQTIPAFRQRTARLLAHLGWAQHYIAREIEAMEELQLAKTASRSILGSMNDVNRHVQIIAERAGSAEAVDWEGEEILMTTRLHGPLDYVHPEDIAKALLE
ncbi:MAG: DUF6933 domain-containing protein, partial [Anaerolineae bacterium]